METNLGTQLKNAINRTGLGSSPQMMDLKRNLPEEENLEATASGGSGQYSALFGDMNEEDEQTTDLTFYKSKFNSDDNSFTAAYKIIDDSSEKVIEVLNIQEIKNENRMFFDKKKSYKIKIYKFRLPKSQVTILDYDTGFEGFKFIKIPYWLVKKNPEQFKIIRINDRKRLDNKYNYQENDLVGKVDEDVVDYIDSLKHNNYNGNYGCNYVCALIAMDADPLRNARGNSQSCIIISISMCTYNGY
jgi:hypothetical protein